jgi:hypothetical protein
MPRGVGMNRRNAKHVALGWLSFVFLGFWAFV